MKNSYLKFSLFLFVGYTVISLGSFLFNRHSPSPPYISEGNPGLKKTINDFAIKIPSEETKASETLIEAPFENEYSQPLPAINGIVNDGIVPAIITEKEAEYFTIQISSSINFEDAQRSFRGLAVKLFQDEIQYVRIEKVQGYYTVRVGKFLEKMDGGRLYNKIKKYYPSALLFSAYLKPERIVTVGEQSAIETYKIRDIEGVSINKDADYGEIIEKDDRAIQITPKTRVISSEKDTSKENLPLKDILSESNSTVSKVEKPLVEINGNEKKNVLLATPETLKTVAVKATQPDSDAEQEVFSMRVISILNYDEMGELLKFPSSLFYDTSTDDLYVVNGGGRVVVFGPEFFPFTSLGKGRRVMNPLGGHVGSNGNLYISGNDSVRYSPKLTILNGAFLPMKDVIFSAMPEAKGFQPKRVSVGLKNKIYLTDFKSEGVLVLDSHGQFVHWLKTFDEKSTAKKEQETRVSKVTVPIRDIAIDSQGNIFLLSEETSKIYVYNSNEQFLFSFGKKGGSSGKLSRPRGIEIDENKKCFYVVDYMRHTVLVYDYSGKFRLEFGGQGWAEGWFNYPSDIEIGRQGQVIVADFYNNRVQVIELTYRDVFPNRPDDLWVPKQLTKK